MDEHFICTRTADGGHTLTTPAAVLFPRLHEDGGFAVGADFDIGFDFAVVVPSCFSPEIARISSVRSAYDECHDFALRKDVDTTAHGGGRGNITRGLQRERDADAVAYRRYDVPRCRVFRAGGSDELVGSFQIRRGRTRMRE